MWRGVGSIRLMVSCCCCCCIGNSGVGRFVGSCYDNNVFVANSHRRLGLRELGLEHY